MDDDDGRRARAIARSVEPMVTRGTVRAMPSSSSSSSSSRAVRASVTRRGGVNIGGGRRRGPVRASSSSSSFDASAAPKLADATPVLLVNDGHADARIPTTPGVYAIYDERGRLQYVGLSRRVAASVKVHAFEMPQYCHSVRCMGMEGASKADLQTAWKTWVMEHVAVEGGLPPGNAPGNTLFSERRARPSKACARLSDGKNPDMTAEELMKAIETCVKEHKIVAFIKGTREEPDCGFSHRMINVLNELMVDYETVNVLDDYYNPNLLFVIKDFSDWPTIPQLYVNGELLGGHDIVNAMHEAGELKAELGA